MKCTGVKRDVSSAQAYSDGLISDLLVIQTQAVSMLMERVFTSNGEDRPRYGNVRRTSLVCRNNYAGVSLCDVDCVENWP